MALVILRGRQMIFFLQNPYKVTCTRFSMKQRYTWTLVFLVFLVLFVSFRTVSSATSLCVGKHNMQLNAATLPEMGINGVNKKVFVLPEVSGFKNLYQDFSVTVAKVYLGCPAGSGTACDLYVNDQLCLGGIGAAQPANLYSLNCANLFRDGINTVDLRQGSGGATGAISWLFFETKISSLVC